MKRKYIVPVRYWTNGMTKPVTTVEVEAKPNPTWVPPVIARYLHLIPEWDALYNLALKAVDDMEDGELLNGARPEYFVGNNLNGMEIIARPWLKDKLTLKRVS